MVENIVTTLICIKTSCVSFELCRCRHSTCNRSPFINFFHHISLTTYTARIFKSIYLSIGSSLAFIFSRAIITFASTGTSLTVRIATSLVRITRRVSDVMVLYPAKSLRRFSLNYCIFTPKQPKSYSSHSSKTWGDSEIKGRFIVDLLAQILIRVLRELIVAHAQPLSHRWGLFWLDVGGRKLRVPPTPQLKLAGRALKTPKSSNSRIDSLSMIVIMIKMIKLVKYHCFLRVLECPLGSYRSILALLSNSYNYFSSLTRFYCFARYIYRMRSRILFVALGPPLFKEGNIETPVPRWKVLPLIEASSVFAAKLRASSFLRYSSFLEMGYLLLLGNLFVFPVLDIEWRPCYEGASSCSTVLKWGSCCIKLSERTSLLLFNICCLRWTFSFFSFSTRPWSTISFSFWF